MQLLALATVIALITKPCLSKVKGRTCLGSDAQIPSNPMHLQEATHEAKRYLKYYDVEKEVEVAQALLHRANVNDRSQRLAVMLLYRWEHVALRAMHPRP